MNELGLMRVSNADRDAVVARLQHATAEGRLSLDELEERVVATLGARTRSDLDELIDDLPPVAEPEPEAEPEPSAAASRARSLGVLAIGASSIPATFYSPGGVVLSLVAIVLVVSTLITHRGTSGVNRAILAAGGAFALAPAGFALALFTLLR
jgi:hypothetical protein